MNSVKKSVKCVFCDEFIVELAASPCESHYYCVLCLEKWRSQSKELTEHYFTLNDELAVGVKLQNSHKCPQCLESGPVKYTAVSLLPEHILEVVEESAPQPLPASKHCLTCDKCQLSFNSTAAKSKHRWKHMPRTRCPWCPTTLTYPSDLNRHKSRCVNRPRVKFRLNKQ